MRSPDPLSANRFFNTQHAPVGAHASLTLGFPGARGGMDLELCGAPGQSVMVALESAQQPGLFETLPFCAPPDDAERQRFVSEQGDAHLGASGLGARLFALDEVQREFSLATDSWQAGDLRFTLYTPVRDLPDPDASEPLDAMRAFVPAVRAEIEVDNRAGTRARRVAVGLSGIDPLRGLRHLSLDEGAGIGDGLEQGFATDAAGAWSGIGFDPLAVLGDRHVSNRASMLGGWGLVCAEVPAGERRTLRFAFCFHRAGAVTGGIATRQLYNRWFDSVESVARFALSDFDEAVQASRAADARLAASALSPAQRFTVAHATRSYLYSTQLLERDGRALWVVNEGEYNMLNTLDLVPDHSLYEGLHHPWTIRNVLDQYAAGYAYDDELRFAGSDATHPGGVSFTHDMGVDGIFAPPGRSAYERAGLTGCFSQMTTEELLNWTLCAGLYVHQGRDLAWARRHAALLERCLQSLERRDHPEPAQRNGVPRADSSRCEGGREITTYDCLDPSLGQAAGNTYIAGKAWAAHVILQQLFVQLDRPALAERAHQQARRAAATIVAAARPDGLIPALLEAPDDDAVILPVIEALAYPWFAGCRDALAPDGEYAPYLAALKRHVGEHVLREDTCLFADGGWRITSRSDNTFPAKSYVCQFVAREILQMDLGAAGTRADDAHATWQLHPELSVHCWSEQVKNGLVFAAKYYPRGVSSQIWLTEGQTEG
ncbi:glycoside hydrolase family 52 protein [Rhizobacter sp. P5_C2]